MATEPSKGLRDSFSDLLDDLLGCDDETSVKPARASQLARSSGGRARGTSLQASKKSFLDDDFFSQLSAEDRGDDEVSSASNIGPEALLQTLKDMDDLDAELGILNPSSGTGKTTMKGPGKHDSLGGGVKSMGKLLTPEKGESVPAMEKPLSSPAASPQYKKFKSEEPPSPQTPQHTVVPVRRAEKLMFEGDDDDLMDALGLGSGLKGDEKQGKKAEEEELRPARFKMDELLGRGSVAKILEQPGMGERKEFQLDKKYQKQPEKEEGSDKEDFVFGAYRPTVASAAKSRLSRRPSASRLSNENSSGPKPEPCSKPPLPASGSPVRSNRGGGNWLGLKDEDFMDLEPLSLEKPSPSGTAGRPGAASQLLATEEAAAKPDPLEEENWLISALARKKAQARAKAQERSVKPSEAPGEGLDPCSPPSSRQTASSSRVYTDMGSDSSRWNGAHERMAHAAACQAGQAANSAGAPRQAAALRDKAASGDGPGWPVPRLSTMKEASAPATESAKGDLSRDTSAPVPTAMLLGEQETQDPAPLAQVTIPRARLQAAPQLQAESAAPVSLHERRLGTPAAQLYEDTSSCEAALRSAQAHVAELESQVWALELERTQHKLLLESLQQRHQEDLNRLESTYRSQMNMMEETYRQQEERLQREKEQLAAQLLSQRQDVEQARAELLAQHQQRLAALEQQNTLEIERLRELQRVSVQEMCKDHEEQLQRLKRLKDQEIDAMTSIVSPTRSLNGIMEQVEKFSSNLHELSHRMEATCRATAQELVVGAQQWDKQFKVLQDNLLQQQRNMEEERRRFQEVIAKMEARLDEQAQLLEQKRWRVTAEQSKVESLQHSVEEQRRVMTQQLATEQAELDRAKSTLLEEQKSVMQKCLEERRKLAAEWAELHTWKQLNKEQMGHDMDRTLQMDCQRESTIMSLGKEQAELKIQAHKLKAKEERLTRVTELLDEACQELRLEKKKVNTAALRIQQQEEEMKSKTKLSSQKYEGGEQALWELYRMDSEHRSRLQVIQQNLEQLKQQELCLHQLQQQRDMLHTNTMTLLTTDVDLSAPTEGLSSTPWFPPSVRVLSQHILESSRETLAMANSTELYAKLLLLKHQAQQDHDFLEDEQFFLENLKKAPYNTSRLSG